MASNSNTSTSLQTTTNFGVQNWQAIYNQYNTSLFLGSYDFPTLRKALINYLQQYNPENYNDYTNSSEFVALVDLIAYMGQSLSYRFDLNARESFLPTAQTSNSIINLANLVNYIPSRNLCATGYLKILSIGINEDVYDNLGNNLNGITVTWNDSTNRNWLDQWNSIINAVLTSSQTTGNPGNSQTINGINYSEYTLPTFSTQHAPYTFTTSINNSSMSFEAVNPSSKGESYIYEVDPYDSLTSFNLLYENDNLGYNSINTGYFLFFKQGSLSSQSFVMSDTLPNSTFLLNNTQINNTDIWLYQINDDGTWTQWTQVESIYNSSLNNIPASNQTIFSVTSGVNDTVTLVFGDGIFGNIPNGNFICYTRSSNGLTYRINPSEMSNITISIPYISKTNRAQILTLRTSLQYTIGNSSSSESLSNIKLKAPQSFYSQNRMVNGQDYNSFPFTQYNNILQIKSVNRTSSGVSRYLDVTDPTGKYSSTNEFCDDGFIYLDDSIVTNNYTYSNLNDLGNIIENQIANIIASSTTLSFIYNNYPMFQQKTINTQWNMVLTDNNSCSGWLGNTAINDTLITINDDSFSSDISDNTSLLVSGSLISFIPPNGYYFDQNNNLILGTTSTPGLNQKNYIYAAVVGYPINEGIGNSLEMNGENTDGSGAITLSSKVPTGSLLYSIYPYFSSILPTTILQSLITNIENNNAIALYFNPYLIGTGINNCWSIEDIPSNFNPTAYGTSFVPPSDSAASLTNSWLLSFIPNGTNNFICYQRSNAYYFGSEQQTSFYYDASAKIYNPINSTTLVDQIKILKTNSSPITTTNLGLSTDITTDIFSTVSESNGVIDPTRVGIQYSNLEATGIPNNPLFFTDIVGNSSYIFFVTDNTQNTTTLISSGSTAVIIVSSPSIINNNLYSYANGTIIFCTANKSFYKIIRSGNVASKLILNNSGDTLIYSYYQGRQDLQFQYHHNAADNRRIDPSPSNIIDIYILEESYATAYQQWITDLTGQISEPAPPSTITLGNDFAELTNYKMISDELIFNSAQFVPLFGSKAETQNQATFICVSNPSSLISSGEIASSLITAINDYFAIGNFNFGQTFYWAPLSQYIMSQLGNIINAVYLVPTAGNLNYGSLEQISCDPYEIFINCATVQNVSVVSSINNLNLKIS